LTEVNKIMNACDFEDNAAIIVVIF
jgi:hypothetical protein